MSKRSPGDAQCPGPGHPASKQPSGTGVALTGLVHVVLRVWGSSWWCDQPAGAWEAAVLAPEGMQGLGSPHGRPARACPACVEVWTRVWGRGTLREW